MLTSVGAKTGKLRKTALMRVEHDGDLCRRGLARRRLEHPVWYHNLKANPHVELQDLADKRDYLAREVFDDEKAVWWDRAVETWPDYASTRRRPPDPSRSSSSNRCSARTSSLSQGTASTLRSSDAGARTEGRRSTGSLDLSMCVRTL